MSLDLLFEHFAQLADAPNGVKKLRQAILQLAVQGKLVPQDPADEPASVLLERIRAEQARRKGQQWLLDDAPPVLAGPYELPGSWMWSTLDDISEIAMGNSPPGDSYNEHGDGVPLINGPVEFSAGPLGKTIKSKFTTKPTRFCEKHDLLVCVRGSTTGRTNIAAFRACIGRGVATIRAKIFQQYLNYFIVSKRKQIYDLGTGSTFPSISYNQLASLAFPLPPLAEQCRIVAKVDQLMALCDELEAQQSERRDMRITLNNAALDHLLAARNAEAVAAHWQRLDANFDLLYDTPETIGKLRQAILQLAVQGKLVPQDPADEPAAVLLERIRAEKARLIEAGEIKREKPLAPIVEGEQPFALPSGWEWVRFQDVSFKIEAGWSPQCDAVPATGDQWGVLKISAVSWGRFNPNENKRLLAGQLPRPEYEVTNGDFLMSRANTAELVAKSVIVEQDVQRLMMSDKVLRVSIVETVIPHYANLVNNSSTSRYYYASQATGTSESMRNITRSQILSLPFPLPPLAEQRRIVAKVEQLMALCDELEAKLNNAQAVSARLVAAVARQVLGGDVAA